MGERSHHEYTSSHATFYIQAGVKREGARERGREREKVGERSHHEYTSSHATFYIQAGVKREGARERERRWGREVIMNTHPAMLLSTYRPG